MAGPPAAARRGVYRARVRDAAGKTVTRRFPITKPDIDKLLRAVCDGITDAGVWKDDAQVIRVVMEEVYGRAPGVHVTVREMSEEPTRGERWLAEQGL